jgi:threonine synthase
MKEFKETGKFSLPKDLHEKAQRDFASARTDDSETLATIKKIHDETGYVLDPHTAVGIKAALEIVKTAKGPVVTLATAHPAKFPDAVEKATGTRPALPAHLADLLSRPEKFEILPNNLQKLQEFIRKNA